ncbi:alkaline phosphatase family protein [Halorhabdus rudnickae]|uniref:alkaline phosphatase family protein n=1 Tax=Halorhabdus rudnickae TaxID=1775544 RepID=UPI0010848AEA|nr:alkaline phosphatase family protein [Halorhabdus rudnickae]
MVSTLVVGIDAATWDILEGLLDAGDLPHLASLRSDGTHGTLTSTRPPMTPQAWTSMVTGVNPGKHGIFDFRTQDPETYEVRPVDATDRRFPTLWDVFDHADRSSGVVNLPVSHPAPSNTSFFVAGFPASVDDDIVAPQAAANHLPDDYRIEPTVDPDDDPAAYLEAVEALMSVRTDLTLSLLDAYDPELCWTVFMGVDWVQHYLWNDQIDGERAVHRAYRHVDAQLGRLLEAIDDDVNVLVVSDHGFREIDGEIHLNSVLESLGELRRYDADDDTGAFATFATAALAAIERFPDSVEHSIKAAVKRAAPASLLRRSEQAAGLTGQRYLHERVEWSATRAFSYGSMGRVFLNRASRYRDGTIEEADYESVRASLAADLEGVIHPETGDQVFEAATPGEEVYTGGSTDAAPDLLLTPTDWRYMIYGGFGDEWLHPPEKRYADHAPAGIFLAAGPDIAAGTCDASVYDVAPTVLALHDLPLVEGMDGAPLTSMLRGIDVSGKTVAPDAIRDELSHGPTDRSTDPDNDVEDRLEDLGYL